MSGALGQIAETLKLFQWILYIAGLLCVFGAITKAIRREVGNAVVLFVGSGAAFMFPSLLGILQQMTKDSSPAAAPSSAPTSAPAPTLGPAVPASQAAAADFSWLPGALLVLAVALVVLLIIWALIHYVRSSLAPSVARKRSAKRLAAELTLAARKTLNAVVLESASYEVDLAKQIDYPMMTDVSEPLVGAYVRQLRTVQELDRALGEAPGVEGARAFGEVVAHLDVSFRAAVARAERVRWSTFTVEERKRLMDARTALYVIEDASTTPEQRNAQYKRITRLLEGLIVLTDPVKLALGECVLMLAIEEAVPAVGAGQ